MMTDLLTVNDEQLREMGMVYQPQRKKTAMTKQFEVGKTYATRSMVDYDTIFRFKIVARTAKQLTFEDHGKQKRRGIFIWDGVEQFKPFGNYSMCPIVSADNTDDPA